MPASKCVHLGIFVILLTWYFKNDFTEQGNILIGTWIFDFWPSWSRNVFPCDFQLWVYLNSAFASSKITEISTCSAFVVLFLTCAFSIHLEITVVKLTLSSPLANFKNPNCNLFLKTPTSSSTEHVFCFIAVQEDIDSAGSLSNYIRSRKASTSSFLKYRHHPLLFLFLNKFLLSPQYHSKENLYFLVADLLIPLTISSG